METYKKELLAVLSQFNPWWHGKNIPDLPDWKRTIFTELLEWAISPPTHRAIMLSGARQVGKTTLMLHTIEALLKNGCPPGNILYLTFDHPIIKQAGLDAVLDAWRELEPKSQGPEYIFLDEAQFIPDMGTWIKHQVDFNKSRKIFFSGSATPLILADQESGVGRWHTLHISTLSFYEYTKIKNIDLPNIPQIESLDHLFNCSDSDFVKIEDHAKALIGHFHDYLIRGGFPQTAVIESIPRLQRLLRDDIIDKVLKRDMTMLFGVRRLSELEQTFVFLCMHSGGIQDLTTLCTNLGVTKPTIQNFIQLLEATHLIHRLPPYGYGKEIRRARYKVYLADASIAPAVLLKGKSLIEDPLALSSAVETTVFHHLFDPTTKISYWHSKKYKEIDFIIEKPTHKIPIEVKYQSQTTTDKDIEGLIEFCESSKKGFVLTKSLSDIGPMPHHPHIMRIPAALFCYWSNGLA